MIGGNIMLVRILRIVAIVLTAASQVALECRRKRC